jgi:hypothetical protein
MEIINFKHIRISNYRLKCEYEYFFYISVPKEKLKTHDDDEPDKKDTKKKINRKQNLRRRCHKRKIIILKTFENCV